MAENKLIQNSLLDVGVPVKRCKLCGEKKPVSEFDHFRQGKGRRKYSRSNCKDCREILRRAWKDRDPDKRQMCHRAMVCKRFGMTIEQYDSILHDQNGVCAICKQPEKVTGRVKGVIKNFAIDHDHETGKPRGLLCSECNNGIGKLKDDPSLLRAAADYIEYHRKLQKAESGNGKP